MMYCWQEMSTQIKWLRRGSGCDYMTENSKVCTSVKIVSD